MQRRIFETSWYQTKNRGTGYRIKKFLFLNFENQDLKKSFTKIILVPSVAVIKQDETAKLVKSVTVDGTTGRKINTVKVSYLLL